MKPLKTHYPNVTLAILDTEPYGSEYPCELVVHWPTCGIEAVVCGYIAQRYSIMLDKALAEEPDLIAHLWNRL